MLKLLACCGASAIVLTVVVGCGGGSDGPETVRVSGTVYLDGEPLEGAEVNFFAEDFSGYGKTSSDGTYELIQGAVPGENKVFIQKWEGDKTQLDPEEGMDEGQIEAMMMAAESEGQDPEDLDIPQQLIPSEYSDPEDTTLTYTVPEGGTDSADFRISSE